MEHTLQFLSGYNRVILLFLVKHTKPWMYFVHRLVPSVLTANYEIAKIIVLYIT